jgi:IS1 family transposase
MNRLKPDLRAQILHLLCEGSSIRAITRVIGVSKNTVAKLLAEAGQACWEYQDRVLRNLPCKRVQVDEIWSFVYAKEKNVRNAKAAPQGAGDQWVWVAIDADTKLVCSWLIGARDAEYADAFMDDLAQRLSHRVQLTSDAHAVYLDAVDGAFGNKIDYAQLVKTYGIAPDAEKRYSPPVCTGAKRKPKIGNPDWDKISASFIERQNLTMRMHMRRFTRLTNAFSKKVENHAHAVALQFMYYNFCKLHKAHRLTPAMAAGVTERLWEVTDIVKVLADWENNQ